MFTALTIAGLGPHVEPATFKLNPTGRTTIVGASETGKTSLIDALVFLLQGVGVDGSAFPVDAISGKRVAVSATTALGAVIARSMPPSRRKPTRTFTREGVETIYETEEDFRVALKAIGQRPDLVRCVMVPEAWVPLAFGKGGGRPLRDLLAQLLRAGSLRTAVAVRFAEAGFALTDGDVIDPKTTEERRADANRKREQAVGARDAAVAAHAAAGPALDGAPDDAGARAVIALAERWAKYATSEAAVVAGTAAIADWQRRSDELGAVPPAPTAGAGTQASSLVSMAKATVVTCEREAATANANLIATARQHAETGDPDMEKQQTAVDGYRAALVKTPTVCPTCKQPTPNAVELAQKTLASAEAFLAELVSSAEARAVARLAPLAEAHNAAIERARAAAEALAKAKATQEKREAELAETTAVFNRFKAWSDANKALGAKPPVPHDALPVPDAARPAPEAVEQSRAVVAGVDRAAGGAAERSAAIARTAAPRATAEAAFTEAEAAAARANALVEAVRLAPSDVARSQIALLGDMGPFSITLTDEGGVDVRVDGRGYWRASRGKRVLADYAFRCALRRALKLPIPVFVDEAQNWSGELPEDPGVDGKPGGPVIVLRTTNDEGPMRVVEGA